MSFTILEPITDRKSETAIPRDIDVSRVRQNYMGMAILPRIAKYNLGQEFFGWEGGFSALQMPFPGIKKRRALL